MSDYITIKIEKPLKEKLDKLKTDLRLSSYSKTIMVALKALNEHQEIAHKHKAKYVDAEVFLNDTP
jgi:metal-responsive CopG/Arc/MetJ family transcriptional regulator